ncbi:MAG: hypothetical protein HY685_02980 [Chloroflexi bacterium]|nr:hypothetical protein [Chloroflexota bacterium]
MAPLFAAIGKSMLLRCSETRAGKGLAFAVVALLLLGIGVSCLPAAQRTGEPSLPARFGQVLPDVPLLGYLLFQQRDQPLQIRWSPSEGKEGATQTSVISVEDFSVYLPSLEDGMTVGARAVFGSEQDATTAERLLREQGVSSVRVGNKDLNLWFLREGATVYLVVGKGRPAEGLKAAFQERRFAAFREKFPQVWRSMLLLPRNSPRPVLAAGFLDVSEEALRQMVAQMDEGADRTAVERLGPFLRQINVRHVVLGAYADGIPVVEQGTDLRASLQERGASFLAVFDSNVAGFLLSRGLGMAVGPLGLRQVDFEGSTAYSYPVPNATVLLKTEGSTLFLAGAFDEVAARYLLRSGTKAN